MSSFLAPENLIKELSLKEGNYVADMGCGSGMYTMPLVKAVGTIGQIYAVDINREMVYTLAMTLEKNNIKNVDVIWADIEKDIPIESFSLDAVVMSNVLFQLEDINKAVENITKTLKPGGRLLIVDWSDSHGGIGPAPEHVVEESKIENILKKYDFKITKEINVGKYHYAFVATVA